MRPNRHRRPSKPCRHEAYLMTCAEYDELADFADDRCQTCGADPRSTPQGVLSIDHDGLLGQWAVRGLLCQPCNVRIEWPDLRGSVDNAYLARPWYRRLLDRAGIDGLTVPEPPLGTWITAGNTMYHRTVDGWQSHWRPKLPPMPVTWQRLCYVRGPHRIKEHGIPSWCAIHHGPPDACRSRGSLEAA